MYPVPSLFVAYSAQALLNLLGFNYFRDSHLYLRDKRLMGVWAYLPSTLV